MLGVGEGVGVDVGAVHVPGWGGGAGQEGVDAGGTDADVEACGWAGGVKGVGVGGVGGGEEVLQPADVVPADGHWWAETVLGEGEFEVEVSGEEGAC